MGLVTMQAARFVFTPEQVKAFGPTGPLIFDGVPGHLVRIYEGLLIKHAGPAFAFGHFGHFVQPQYDTTPRIAALTCFIQGVLDQTDEASFYGHPASTQHLLSPESVARALGKGVRMGVNGHVNTYTGDGSTVELALSYAVIPANQVDLALAIPETPLP